MPDGSSGCVLPRRLGRRSCCFRGLWNAFDPEDEARVPPSRSGRAVSAQEGNEVGTCCGVGAVWRAEPRFRPGFLAARMGPGFIPSTSRAGSGWHNFPGLPRVPLCSGRFRYVDAAGLQMLAWKAGRLSRRALHPRASPRPERVTDYEEENKKSMSTAIPISLFV